MALINACYIKKLEKYSQTKFVYWPRSSLPYHHLINKTRLLNLKKPRFKGDLGYYYPQYKKHTSITKEL